MRIVCGLRALCALAPHVCCSDDSILVCSPPQAAFPHLMPAFVSFGDGVRPGTVPSRRTRARFLFKGRMLDEHKPIGSQCLSESFSKYF